MQSIPLNRRSGHDRRKFDMSLEPRFERRRGVEPRKPELTELDLSLHEWEQLCRDLLPAKYG
ncbi:MAG: hypothetical protein JOY60_07075 [Burkholderiaceae bacterium]|nr:hypothetical protein [Roseateles sp.]MBV8469607.1 hypothetical protein [Burkholderiaceae bacterium]